MKRAAIYLRVSTLDQHPESQVYDLEQLARQRNLEIVNRYTDRISGTRARRPGLDQMMADARRGRFDVVLVWACDRIARSVRHFLEVLDELDHINVEFASFREQLDTGGPLGRAVASSSAPSQNSSATLLWSVYVPACGGPSSKASTSVGRVLTSTAQPCFVTASVDSVSASWPRCIVCHAPPSSAACNNPFPQENRYE
jgi:hypothetical protein